MGKEDFCFTYYDGDAARDKSHLNRLERGAYDDLISAQRKFGHLTIAQIKKILSSDFENCWDALEWILKKDESDKYYISWLEMSLSKSNKSFSNEETFVYIIKLSCSFETFIKIGISNNPDKRYKDYERSGFIVQEVLRIKFANRIYAEYSEIIYHRQHLDFKYIPKIKFAGQHECFSIDILKSIQPKLNIQWH